MNLLRTTVALSALLVAGTAVFAGNDPTTYAGRIAAIRNAATMMTA